MESEALLTEDQEPLFIVSVLMACHNRRKTTIECLNLLYAAKPLNWILNIYLVDDGSTDGTSEAVHKFDSNIQIIKGNGDWYWAHSMYQAEKAINKPHHAILWLNDDVELFYQSLNLLNKCKNKFPQSILVGQLREKDSETISYGGLMKEGRHPLRFKLVDTKGEILRVDNFTGNFVFIPSDMADIMGGIDGSYDHAYADIDYGYRAQKLKLSVHVLPNFIGFCSTNKKRIIGNRREAFSELIQKKSLPLNSQVRFLRKHGGIEWPIYLISPFIKILFNKNK